MNAFPVNPSSSDDGSLQSLTRLVRRICLLTEQGDEAEAIRLESTQLAEAVRQYRHDHGPDALTEQHLGEIFVHEQRRAADAVVLAELLIPQLAGQSRAGWAQGASLSVHGARSPSVEPPAGSMAAAAFDTAAAREAARTQPASIPDFLDAMLAGETSQRRIRLFPQSSPSK